MEEPRPIPFLNMKEDTRERVTIVSKNDLDVSYFCGSGAGGQARNKVASGVQIKHIESGAIGRASDTRSQHENKKLAFKRLVETPQMKFWIAKKVYEIKKGETIERTVEESMKPENMKFEIKNAVGQWEEVNDTYFNGPAAMECST